jgi:hypothetical protein
MLITDNSHDMAPKKRKNGCLDDLLFFGIIGIIIIIGNLMKEPESKDTPHATPYTLPKTPSLERHYFPPNPSEGLSDDSLERMYDRNYMDFDYENNPDDDDEWWEYFND